MKLTRSDSSPDSSDSSDEETRRDCFERICMTSSRLSLGREGDVAVRVRWRTSVLARARRVAPRSAELSESTSSFERRFEMHEVEREWRREGASSGDGVEDLWWLVRVGGGIFVVLDDSWALADFLMYASISSCDKARAESPRSPAACARTIFRVSSESRNNRIRNVCRSRSSRVIPRLFNSCVIGDSPGDEDDDEGAGLVSPGEVMMRMRSEGEE